MSIGENIRLLREAKGVSQVQMAKDLYMTNQMLCAIENDIKNPSLNIALAMAKYLGVSVEKMCGREA